MLTSKQRVVNQIRGQAVDRLPLMPITMQFSAALMGVRYREYAMDYRKLVEAQIRVAGEFGFDYVSCISDPGRESYDCGAKVIFAEDSPPAHDEADALLTDKTRLAGLKIPDPAGGGRMTDRLKAVELFKQRVGNEKLIEGWIEGPCAEGVDLRGMNNLMMDFFEDETFVRDLFAFCTEMGIIFAKAQLAAGADLIGIGDAAASLVGPDIYREFVFPGEKQMVDAIHAAGGLVRLHICGDTRHSLAQIGKLGCDIVDLDYLAPIAEARAAMGPNQVLLGNVDPVRVVRNGTPDAIRAAFSACRAAAGGRYIVGAGCEIPRDTPHENIRAMADVV
ncbi:MAG: uroporphyrinogen decarboxylase family protein [Tepidisphaerales bacterium]